MEGIYSWRKMGRTVVCVTLISVVFVAVIVTMYVNRTEDLIKNLAVKFDSVQQLVNSNFPVYAPVVNFASTQHQVKEKIPNTKDRTLGDLLPFLTSPVVMTTVNSGYLQIVRNLLKSIEKVHVNVSIVLICEDESMYDLFSNSTGVYAVITEFSRNLKQEQKFRSRGYNEIVNRRISYVLQLIEGGIDTLYLDCDTIWLQDPFPYFDSTSDLFVQQEAGVPYCAGMFFVRATKPSIKMMSLWRELAKDRDNQVSYNQAIKATPELRVKGLPQYKFVGGEIYFKESTPWHKRDPAPVIVHATFRLGSHNKEVELKKCGLWYVDDTEIV